MLVQNFGGTKSLMVFSEMAYIFIVLGLLFEQRKYFGFFFKKTWNFKKCHLEATMMMI